MLTVRVPQTGRSWLGRSPRLCSLLKLCLPECPPYRYGAKLQPGIKQACHGQQGRFGAC